MVVLVDAAVVENYQVVEVAAAAVVENYQVVEVVAAARLVRARLRIRRYRVAVAVVVWVAVQKSLWVFVFDAACLTQKSSSCVPSCASLQEDILVIWSIACCELCCL